MNQADNRQVMEADIACVGFGPAMGGFLTTLSREIMKPDGSFIESKVMPGMPLQVLCYERADDLSFGVSGIVTRGRAIRESYTQEELLQIPMSHAVTEEQVFYLLDPNKKSRKSRSLRFVEGLVKALKFALPVKEDAIRLPKIPSFLEKRGGMIFSMGQLNQWVASQVMGSGTAQLWPGSPVGEALIEDEAVKGVRLLDQGTDKDGNPVDGFMPGMDIRAGLTVVGDGPVGAVGKQLDSHFGMPNNNHQREWAIGMKAVVELPAECALKPGTVFHTMGYPQPEIFGFLYVYPDNLASLGIFVPSWFDCPTRTAYQYLQHFMKHPKIWSYIKGGTLRSWGAKSLQEAGRTGEPFLVGNGYARIGEGSGSTNVLTGSGVDEAWATGVQLAQSVLELLDKNLPFTKENLENTYVQKRRSSWVDKESQIAQKARNGFQRGFLRGLWGMGLAGFSGGRMGYSNLGKKPHERVPSLEAYYSDQVSPQDLERLKKEAENGSAPLHELIMEHIGWPKIDLDGQLMVTQQDALLMGGKVQAPQGYKDHVTFKDTNLCMQCQVKLCYSVCSGQAITPGENGVPHFENEKCVHCGVCFWNCTQPDPDNPDETNIKFSAGPGGLHSAEN